MPFVFVLLYIRFWNSATLESFGSRKLSSSSADVYIIGQFTSMSKVSGIVSPQTTFICSYTFKKSTELNLDASWNVKATGSWRFEYGLKSKRIGVWLILNVLRKASKEHGSFVRRIIKIAGNPSGCITKLQLQTIMLQTAEVMFVNVSLNILRTENLAPPVRSSLSDSGGMV